MDNVTGRPLAELEFAHRKHPERDSNLVAFLMHQPEKCKDKPGRLDRWPTGWQRTPELLLFKNALRYQYRENLNSQVNESFGVGHNLPEQEVPHVSTGSQP
jgi:hypothetical protein